MRTCMTQTVANQTFIVARTVTDLFGLEEVRNNVRNQHVHLLFLVEMNLLYRLYDDSLTEGVVASHRIWLARSGWVVDPTAQSIRNNLADAWNDATNQWKPCALLCCANEHSSNEPMATEVRVCANSISICSK